MPRTLATEVYSCTSNECCLYSTVSSNSSGLKTVYHLNTCHDLHDALRQQESVQASGPGLATPLPEALIAQRKAANPREKAGDESGKDVEYP